MMKLKKKNILGQPVKPATWLWDWDNLIENKLKQIMKSNSQSSMYWKVKLKKNIQLKKRYKKQFELIWVNQLNS
jgi:hypothetical protein